MKKSRSRSSSKVNILATVIAVLLAMVFILPALWILGGSLRPPGEIFGSISPLSWRTLIPTSVSLDNYISLLSGGFATSLGNSFIAAILAVAVGLALSALASYALAVLSFRGRSVVFAFVVVGFMVPFEAIAIPLSQQFGAAGLANTLVGLVLPAIGNGLAIFNLRQHFLSVPDSMREAARIDGASEIRILWSIYIPNSGSALTNSGLLIFLGQWTSYLWPLLVINEQDLQVAPVSLAKTFGEYSTDFGQNFAGAVMLTLVPALLMFAMQRYFGGIAFSSGEK